MNVTESSKNPLFSDLAGDEDMLDLLESFVSQLPNRASAMTAAFESGDVAQAKVLAHQLKGAAGSYGFTPISEACLAFEGCIAESGTGDAAEA